MAQVPSPSRLLAATIFSLALGLPAAAQERVALVFGDSLMAGYGLGANEGFVPQLAQALAARGVTGWRLENAAVSGDTTTSGLARLDWTLAGAPDAVLLGLGANDMLQGIAPATIKTNLNAIMDRFAADGTPVMLFGMLANRGLGPEYVSAFDGLYPALADEYQAPLYPFFLDGVVGDARLNLSDRAHPNPDGIAEIVARTAPAIAEFLNAQ